MVNGEKPPVGVPPIPPQRNIPVYDREARTRGQRSLFINVMLMFLISIIVTLISIFFFVVPRLAEHNLRLHQLGMRMDAVEAEDEEYFEEGSEPPAPSTAPEPAPAPTGEAGKPAPDGGIAPIGPAPATPAGPAPSAPAPAPGKAAPAPAPAKVVPVPAPAPTPAPAPAKGAPPHP